MPVVTFTICALLPFLTKTTLASFSRSSFCACFSRRSLLSSALLSSLSRAATFCFCFSISSGLKLVSPVRIVTLCIGTATASLAMFVSMSPVQLSPGRFSGVRDLLNDTFKFAIAVRVDFDVCLIPKFHVHDIIFVHVHHGLHVAEIGDSHHIGPGKLIGRD